MTNTTADIHAELERYRVMLAKLASDVMYTSFLYNDKERFEYLNKAVCDALDSVWKDWLSPPKKEKIDASG
jgi:hypothetical protein